MSSTLHPQKTSTIRTLNDRNLMSLCILAAIVVTLLVVFANAADHPTAKSINNEAYMIYRQAEWDSVPIPMDNAEAYLIYRQGEWTSVAFPAVDLTVYHQSERTLIDPNGGLKVYQLSERTLIDPQAEMALYWQSERALHPARNLSSFNLYQQSEWFGK